MDRANHDSRLLPESFTPILLENPERVSQRLLPVLHGVVHQPFHVTTLRRIGIHEPLIDLFHRHQAIGVLFFQPSNLRLRAVRHHAIHVQLR